LGSTDACATNLKLTVWIKHVLGLGKYYLKAIYSTISITLLGGWGQPRAPNPLFPISGLQQLLVEP